MEVEGVGGRAGWKVERARCRAYDPHSCSFSGVLRGIGERGGGWVGRVSGDLHRLLVDAIITIHPSHSEWTASPLCEPLQHLLVLVMPLTNAALCRIPMLPCDLSEWNH